MDFMSSLWVPMQGRRSTVATPSLAIITTVAPTNLAMLAREAHELSYDFPPLVLVMRRGIYWLSQIKLSMDLKGIEPSDCGVQCIANHY
jgi:hypothetical protein